VGDCVACHTAPEGKPYAGGFPLRRSSAYLRLQYQPRMPLRYRSLALALCSRDARRGRSQGRHLYPAFPTTISTIVTDQRSHGALRFSDDARGGACRNAGKRVTFPLNIRMLIAAGSCCISNPPAFVPTRRKNTEWNRGAYRYRDWRIVVRATPRAMHWVLKSAISAWPAARPKDGTRRR